MGGQVGPLLGSLLLGKFPESSQDGDSAMYAAVTSQPKPAYLS
jgi:hypothetical protein